MIYTLGIKFFVNLVLKLALKSIRNSLSEEGAR